MQPHETGQLMLCHSDDDGLTWSQPTNITAQIKDPKWRFVLQGPGRGLTMADGTLVLAAQYRSAPDGPHQGKPFSTMLSSKDRGKTWQIGAGVKVDTTEAQLVELDDGVLMINCRDNRRGSRSVYTTKDLGKTWRVHETSRQALIEPTCMASLLRVDHQTLGDLLVFSNPNSTAGRFDMTLKVSADNGATWPSTWHTRYDQRLGAGYSCLTRIDDDHVGVLYEGIRELYFLRFPIHELVHQ
jgi:sialidase-1